MKKEREKNYEILLEKCFLCANFEMMSENVWCLIWKISRWLKNDSWQVDESIQ